MWHGIKIPEGQTTLAVQRAARGAERERERERHTNLGSAHNPRGTEGRPGDPKEEHINPATKKADW